MALTGSLTIFDKIMSNPVSREDLEGLFTGSLTFLADTVSKSVSKACAV